MGNIIQLINDKKKQFINDNNNNLNNNNNFECLKWNLFGKTLFINENLNEIDIKRVSSKIHYRFSKIIKDDQNIINDDFQSHNYDKHFINLNNNNHNDNFNDNNDIDDLINNINDKNDYDKDFKNLSKINYPNDKNLLKIYKHEDLYYKSDIYQEFENNNDKHNNDKSKNNDKKDNIFFMDCDMIFYAKKKNFIISPLWLSGLMIFLMPTVSFEDRPIFHSLFNSKLEYKNLIKYFNHVSQFIKNHKENDCIEFGSLWKEKLNDDQIHWNQDFLKWAIDCKKELHIYETNQKLETSELDFKIHEKHENNITNGINGISGLNGYNRYNGYNFGEERDLFHFMEKWIKTKIDQKFNLNLIWNKNKINDYFSLESWFVLNQIYFYHCYLLSKNCQSKLMPFYLSKKESITITMLHIEKEIFNYYEDSDIQYIIVPCKNNDKDPNLECHFIIPIDDRKEPHEFIDKVIDQNGLICVPFEKKMGTVNIPLFKIEKQNENVWKSIKSILKVDNIHFSSIFSRENTILDKIYEKISFQLSYLPPSSSFQLSNIYGSDKIKDEEKYSKFNMEINKPFLFLLYEPKTKIIIFIAQIYYPKQ